MKLGVSFDGNERTYESVPPGKYEAFINAITEKSETLLLVRLVIASGQHANRSLLTNCSMTPEGKWKFQNMLIGCGLWKDSQKGDWEGDTNDLIGRKTCITVIEEEYNGEMRPAVRNFFPVKGEKSESAPASGSAPAPTSPQGPPPPPKASAPAMKRL
jgi:hypothetical protein